MPPPSETSLLKVEAPDAAVRALHVEAADAWSAAR